VLLFDIVIDPVIAEKTELPLDALFILENSRQNCATECGQFVDDVAR
jgi:hypothetical protein